MSNGGYKGASPARETSPEQYPGVWELTEQFQAQADGNWPFQAADCAPKSLRFDGSSAYLSRTLTASSNRRTWTMSMWVKRGKLGALQDLFSAGQEATNDGKYARFQFMADDTFRLRFWTQSGSLDANLQTTRVFRDCSAFYHFVIRHDSTEPNQEDRLRIYVNNELITSYSSPDYLSQNVEGHWNYSAKTQMIGAHYDGGGSNTDAYFDGYISEVHHIDGQSLPPEEFAFEDGQGIWQPKRFTGDYSSGPFYSNQATRFTNPANAFDGSDSTYAEVSSTGAKGKFTFPAVSVNSTVTIKFGSGTAGNIWLNGAQTAMGTTGTQTQNISFTGDLTTIEIQSGSQPVVYYIEADGVRILDSSVGRNSFKLDFSDGVKDQSGLGNNWTATNLELTTGASTVAAAYTVTGTTGTADLTSLPNSNLATFANIFDGTTQAYYTGSSNSFSATVTLAQAISYTSTTIRIYHATLNNIDVITTGGTVNASTSGSNTGAYDYNILPSGHSITGFTFNVNSNQTNDQVSYIEVDGQKINLFGQPNDLLVDSPVNGNEASTGAAGTRRGNYCTMNPLKNSLALSDGNLKVTGTSGWMGSTGTIGMSSGKYYWEYGDVVSNEHIIGVVKASFLNPSSTVGTNDAYGYGSETGGKYDPVGGSNQSYGSSWTTGDTIGVAFDADNGNLYFYKNGTIQNSGNPAFTGLTDGPYLPSVVQNGSSRSAVLNFGQRPFKYQNAGTDRPSTDYKPLATSFLPEPTFKRPDEAFDIALWDGNGSSQTITYPRLSPDLIWLKERTNTSDHGWWNTLSGVSKYLSSNLTDDEFDTTTEMNSLNEDGFTVGSSSMTNENSQDYVGWAWDAGEATTTISAGGSNSLAYDQSQTWSNSLSASFRSSEPATNAFDGDTSTIAGSAGSITYTSPVAVASSSTIRVIVHGGDHNVSVNSGANQTVAAGSFVTLNFTNPTNNTFTITFDRVAGGADTGVRAIEIGGKLLVDNGVSVTNVPEVECKVRANQAAGFSIIKVDNPTATEGRVHGLSKTPDMVICKSTASSDSWHTYWKLLGKDYYINLNGSSAKSSSDQFGSQEANSHSFYVKNVTGSGANKAGGMLYFAWHSVEGFSKFGEYTANNSASGPFIYCGFKPKLVLIWCHNQGEGRNMFDTERHPNNFNGKFIKAGDPNQEPTGNTESFAIDIVSNGFKPRGQWGGINDSNTTAKYLFAAWAEQPFSSQARAR